MKTRLLAILSPQEVTELAWGCLEDVASLCNRLRFANPYQFLDGEPRRVRHSRLFSRRSGWRVYPQIGRSLGERLGHAFRRMFRMGHRRIVVIGTDTPWMGPARVKRAFEMLKKVDVVVGPSCDGGYYLIGARHPIPELFRCIPWSTREVLNATRLALERARATYDVLPCDFDLDRPADLERAARLLTRNPERAPVLAKILKNRR